MQHEQTLIGTNKAVAHLGGPEAAVHMQLASVMPAPQHLKCHAAFICRRIVIRRGRD